MLFDGNIENEISFITLKKVGGKNYEALTNAIWFSACPLFEVFKRWSPYAYSYNSPLTFRDPTGLAPEKEKYKDEILDFPDENKEFWDQRQLELEKIHMDSWIENTRLEMIYFVILMDIQMYITQLSNDIYETEKAMEKAKESARTGASESNDNGVSESEDNERSNRSAPHLRRTTRNPGVYGPLEEHEIAPEHIIRENVEVYAYANNDVIAGLNMFLNSLEISLQAQTLLLRRLNNEIIKRGWTNTKNNPLTVLGQSGKSAGWATGGISTLLAGLSLGNNPSLSSALKFGINLRFIFYSNPWYIGAFAIGEITGANDRIFDGIDWIIEDFKRHYGSNWSNGQVNDLRKRRKDYE